jgi:23S rRNA pseudouridine1911/1915/1917 synthase
LRRLRRFDLPSSFARVQNQRMEQQNEAQTKKNRHGSENLETFALKVEAGGIRLDQFLALHFPAISLTRLRRAILEGAARVNGRASRQGWILQPDDAVTIEIDPREATAAKPEPIALEIVHEDADILVVNKPTGMLAHPSAKEKSGTLMNAVAYHLLTSKNFSRRDAARPILLHRLDRDTSGVIVIAKNERANRIIFKAWQKGRVRKKYLALVCGILEKDAGMIDAPIGRSHQTFPRWRVTADGARAQTRFVVKERFADYTLLELEPLTGRTHQLRIHCAHIGHAIVGDKVYKSANRSAPPLPCPIERQLLHAHQLTFRHPTTGEEMTFTAALPPLMQEVLRRLRETSTATPRAGTV